MTTSLTIEGITYTISEDVDGISKISGVFIDGPEQMKGIVTGTISSSNNANDKMPAVQVIAIKPTTLQLDFFINTSITAGSTDITRRIIEDAQNKGNTVGLIDTEFYDEEEYGSGDVVNCVITDCNFRRSAKESDLGKEILAQVSLREIST